MSISKERGAQHETEKITAHPKEEQEKVIGRLTAETRKEDFWRTKQRNRRTQESHRRLGDGAVLEVTV